MITEKDLLEAIAECQGTRNPKADTCLKLASYYTILDHVKTEEVPPVQSYSYAGPPEDRTIQYSSNSEFSEAINGRPDDDVWPIIDELMEVLKVVNTRLYNGVMRKITQLP